MKKKVIVDYRKCLKCGRGVDILKLIDVYDKIWENKISKKKKIEFENKLKFDGLFVLKKKQKIQSCNLFYCPKCKTTRRYDRLKQKSKYDTCNYLGKNMLVYRKIYLQHFDDIPDGFHIHHKNGIKEDNQIENLELLTPSEHSKKHCYGILKRKVFRKVRKKFNINDYKYKFKNQKIKLENFNNSLEKNIKIWKLIDSDKDKHEIAKILNVSVSSVRTSWSFFQKNYLNKISTKYHFK